MSGELNTVRIDRWLWAARFFKTRSLAKTAIEGGKIAVDGMRPKPSKEIRVGQTVVVRRGEEEFEVTIDALAKQRGSAAIAQTLYTESLASIEKRQTDQAQRRMERAGLRVPASRPDKKQRRDLRRMKSLSDDEPTGEPLRD